MTCNNVVSTFPIALGAKISGVDDCTFSSTGEAYSMVALPNTNNSNERKLQADDVSLGAPTAPRVPRPCTLSNPAPVPRSLRICKEGMLLHLRRPCPAPPRSHRVLTAFSCLSQFPGVRFSMSTKLAPPRPALCP